LLDQLFVTWLLELGPVVLIVPELLPSHIAAAPPPAEPFITDTDVLVELALEAIPLPAPPPLVLPLTLAEPDDAP